MKNTRIWAAVLACGLMSACGGGGGGDAPAPQPQSDTTRVTLAGVVSKGAMAHAVVSAHAIAGNGSVDTGTTLATGMTDASGAYSLEFTAASNQPYVIRVRPRTDGGLPATTQLDEISGPTPVAADFSMRALIIPATTGPVSVSASITPFSEMAVAAAENASGGVSSGNAAQAISNVTQLLGFNPTLVTPATIGAASGTQQQTLAVMLTAVSRLANDGALGCNAATLAERTKCVVDTLGSTATLNSIKPGSNDSGDVSQALIAAVAEVAADPVLTGGASLGAATVIPLASLEGDGTPVLVGAGTPAGDAIAAAKLLFTNLRSDWQALFSDLNGSSAGTNTFRAESDKFLDAMNGVQAPADVLLKDAGVLLMGIDLYNDYMAGRTTINSRGRAPGETESAIAISSPGNPDAFNAVGCTLYQDEPGASLNPVPATSPANVTYIGCRASYFLEFTGDATTQNIRDWRHGFTITPDAAIAGTFAYTTRARRRDSTCPLPCTQDNTVVTANAALQANFHAGTITATLQDNARIVGFTISGELPGAFVWRGTALENDYHVWSLSGTRTLGAVPGDSSSTVHGQITSHLNGSLVGTLTLGEGSLLSEVPVSRDAQGNIVARHSPNAVENAGGELATADLALTWATPTASFTGRLALTDAAWDESLSYQVPTRGTLTGTFSNIAGGVATQFLSGTFTVAATGYAQFDNTLPVSASNDIGLDFSFVGTVSAPSRPTLELTLATSGRSSDTEVGDVTLNYRSRTGTQTTSSITVTSSLQTDGTRLWTFTEASAGLSLNLAEGIRMANLLRDGSELVGVVDHDRKLLTFIDGTFISVDAGF